MNQIDKNLFKQTLGDVNYEFAEKYADEVIARALLKEIRLDETQKIEEYLRTAIKAHKIVAHDQVATVITLVMGLISEKKSEYDANLISLAAIELMKRYLKIEEKNDEVFNRLLADIISENFTVAQDQVAEYQKKVKEVFADLSSKQGKIAEAKNDLADVESKYERYTNVTNIEIDDVSKARSVRKNMGIAQLDLEAPSEMMRVSEELAQISELKLEAQKLKDTFEEQKSIIETLRPFLEGIALLPQKKELIKPKIYLSMEKDIDGMVKAARHKAHAESQNKSIMGKVKKIYGQAALKIYTEESDQKRVNLYARTLYKLDTWLALCLSAIHQDENFPLLDFPDQPDALFLLELKNHIQRKILFLNAKFAADENLRSTRSVEEILPPALLGDLKAVYGKLVTDKINSIRRRKGWSDEVVKKAEIAVYVAFANQDNSEALESDPEALLDLALRPLIEDASVPAVAYGYSEKLIADKWSEKVNEVIEQLKSDYDESENDYQGLRLALEKYTGPRPYLEKLAKASPREVLLGLFEKPLSYLYERIKLLPTLSESGPNGKKLHIKYIRSKIAELETKVKEAQTSLKRNDLLTEFRKLISIRGEETTDYFDQKIKVEKLDLSKKLATLESNYSATVESVKAAVQKKLSTNLLGGAIHGVEKVEFKLPEDFEQITREGVYILSNFLKNNFEEWKQVLTFIEKMKKDDLELFYVLMKRVVYLNIPIRNLAEGKIHVEIEGKPSRIEIPGQFEKLDLSTADKLIKFLEFLSHEDSVNQVENVYQNLVADVEEAYKQAAEDQKTKTVAKEKPKSKTVPKEKPKPKTARAPKLKPTKPNVEPATKRKPKPAPKPAPKPNVEPAPKPAPKPNVEPAPKPAPEPEVEPKTELPPTSAQLAEAELKRTPIEGQAIRVLSQFIKITRQFKEYLQDLKSTSPDQYSILTNNLVKYKTEIYILTNGEIRLKDRTLKLDESKLIKLNGKTATLNFLEGVVLDESKLKIVKKYRLPFTDEKEGALLLCNNIYDFFFGEDSKFRVEATAKVSNQKANELKKQIKKVGDRFLFKPDCLQTEETDLNSEVFTIEKAGLEILSNYCDLKLHSAIRLIALLASLKSNDPVKLNRLLVNLKKFSRVIEFIFKGTVNGADFNSIVQKSDPKFNVAPLSSLNNIAEVAQFFVAILLDKQLLDLMQLKFEQIRELVIAKNSDGIKDLIKDENNPLTILTSNS